MRYIILGSGIAGMAAAEAIRHIDSAADIEMVSAEKELCFNRPMLIRDFALDESGEELFKLQQDWPQQNNVKVRLGTKAADIDREKKLVRVSELSSGETETLSYDKLIYALGAEAAVPPLPGAEKDHVFVVRTREDMRHIRQKMRGAKHAAVIGGGMLGLEDAWALHEEKLNVSIIEQKQRVAFGQIDQSAGNLMKKRIERMGVNVYVNVSVAEIGEKDVSFVQNVPEDTDNAAAGETISVPADLVILSTGVRPNSALGERAGLTVSGAPGTNRWIEVNEYCRTSDPDIFAAGDAAAVNGRNDAIWDEARQMGRTAGTNAALQALADHADSIQDAGLHAYERVTAEHVFTGFDTEVFTMADSSGQGTDGVYIRHADVEIFDYKRERYIRVSLQDGSIAGLLLINAPELAPELMEAYKNGEGEDEARQIIQRWKESHDVNFKPATPFRRR